MVLDPVWPIQSSCRRYCCCRCRFCFRCYRCYRFVTVIPVMVPAVRYCRYMLYWLWLVASRLVDWFGSIILCFRLKALSLFLPPAIIFSFLPIRIVSILLVNTLLSSTLSMLSCQLIRLDASNSRSRVDEASFFLLLLPAKILLAFLLPLIQPSFFVVLVTLASYPYSYCSCSCIPLVVDVILVALLVYYVLSPWHKRVLDSCRL